jgi:hypothetical protein
MDPYLEQFWPDIHARLILYASDQLEEQLPGNLIARVEERVVCESEESYDYWIYPDVKIEERPGKAAAGGVGSSLVGVMEPVIVHCRSEPATETYIHILDPGSGYRLVTVIDILSLANKLPGKGQRQYRRKQDQLKQAHVSIVEIDLLRRGKRVLSVPLKEIPPRARTTYQVCVRRGWKPDFFEVYPVPIQDRLPSIRIPLRKKDTDIRLDLQAVVDLAYRKGRYHGTLNYQEPPDPPLLGAAAKWAKSIVKKAKGGNRSN